MAPGALLFRSVVQSRLNGCDVVGFGALQRVRVWRPRPSHWTTRGFGKRDSPRRESNPRTCGLSGCHEADVTPAPWAGSAQGFVVPLPAVRSRSAWMHRA